MTGLDLGDQLVLDVRIVDVRVIVRGRRRDDVLADETAAPDRLIRALRAARGDDVRVVLGQPVDVGAVEHALVEGRHARRGRAAHLRQVGAGTIQHLHDLHVRNHAPAVVREMSTSRRREGLRQETARGPTDE
jgi:hypothetical protein